MTNTKTVQLVAAYRFKRRRKFRLRDKTAERRTCCSAKHVGLSLVRARQLRFIDLHPTHPAAPVAVC